MRGPQDLRCQLAARQATNILTALGEKVLADFQQVHAAELTGAVLEGDSRRCHAVLERVDRQTTTHVHLVVTADAGAGLRGLVVLIGQQVDKSGPGLVDGVAISDLCIDRGVVQLQLAADGANLGGALALFVAGGAGERFGINRSRRVNRRIDRLGAGDVVFRGVARLFDCLGRHRGLLVGLGGLRPFNDTGVFDLAIGRAEPCLVVRANGHRGNLHRLPISCDDAGAAVVVALNHFVAMDLIAHRHIADDPALDVAPDRFNVVTFRQADQGSALSVLNPCALDHADHIIQRPIAVRVQKRRAIVQAVQPDRLGRDVQLFQHAAQTRHVTANCRASGPNHLDRAGRLIDAVHTQLHVAAKPGQLDLVCHIIRHDLLLVGFVD